RHDGLDLRGGAGDGGLGGEAVADGDRVAGGTRLVVHAHLRREVGGAADALLHDGEVRAVAEPAASAVERPELPDEGDDAARRDPARDHGVVEAEEALLALARRSVLIARGEIL